MELITAVFFMVIFTVVISVIVFVKDKEEGPSTKKKRKHA
jgi:hypothetical protein